MNKVVSVPRFVVLVKKVMKKICETSLLHTLNSTAPFIIIHVPTEASTPLSGDFAPLGFLSS
jgi:hypothetical protein